MEDLLQPIFQNHWTRSVGRTRRRTRPEPKALRTGVLSTGVPGLDELLGGGLPPASSVLLHGPPFSGRSLLQRRFFMEGLRERSPAVCVITDCRVEDLRHALWELDPRLAEYEKEGWARYVDCYSGIVGRRPDRNPDAFAVRDPRDPIQVQEAVEAALGDAELADRPSRVVFQSLSTLIDEVTPVPTLRLLRMLLGRLTGRGVTTLAALEQGRHPESQVQAVRNLCFAELRLREQEGRHSMWVEGLRTTAPSDWIPYSFTITDLEVQLEQVRPVLTTPVAVGSER